MSIERQIKSKLPCVKDAYDFLELFGNQLKLLTIWLTEMCVEKL